MRRSKDAEDLAQQLTEVGIRVGGDCEGLAFEQTEPYDRIVETVLVSAHYHQ